MGITPQQFRQMQERLDKPRRTPAPVAAQPERVGLVKCHEIVLGIDPSLRGTGFGIVHVVKPRPVSIAHGTISCPPAWERSRCLAQIAQSLRDLIRTHHPTICIIEGLFYAQNLQTALIMGEARGAALATLGEAGIEIYEVAPRKVKQSIVGYGAADKSAVAKMVQRMLNLPEPPAADAADALALALTQVQEQGRYSLRAPKKV